MSLATERAALVAVLSSVPGIGVVHGYERYAADLATLRTHYTTEIDGQRQLRGWFVQRVKTTEERSARKAYFDRTAWMLRGYMGLDDAAQSELVFDGLIEAVRDALRADLTLGGTVMLPDKDDTAGPTVDAGPVLFAGVLCHSATITVINKRFIQTP